MKRDFFAVAMWCWMHRGCFGRGSTSLSWFGCLQQVHIHTQTFSLSMLSHVSLPPSCRAATERLTTEEGEYDVMPLSDRFSVR